jgi:hypothetical protein
MFVYNALLSEENGSPFPAGGRVEFSHDPQTQKLFTAD